MEILRSWGVEDEVRAGAADVEPRRVGHRHARLHRGQRGPARVPDGSRGGRGQPDPAGVGAAGPSRTDPAGAAPRHGDGGGSLRAGAGRARAGATACRRRSSTGDQVAVCAVDAAYVIGADGAHSTVRGAARHRHGRPRRHGRVPPGRVPGAAARDRRRPALRPLRDHPSRRCLRARPAGAGDRWGLSRERRAGQPRMVDQDDEEVIRLVATAAGVPGVRPRLERRSSFSFAAQIADRYRQGRGFLVGDAAHRMTPRGGTGMNTAIQDAYDIGWKLGWVVRGWAGPELLDSYETDRRPVGVHNVERAGSPDGARRDAQDALPWDLNGRARPPLGTPRRRDGVDARSARRRRHRARRARPDGADPAHRRAGRDPRPRRIDGERPRHRAGRRPRAPPRRATLRSTCRRRWRARLPSRSWRRVRRGRGPRSRSPSAHPSAASAWCAPASRSSSAGARS